ncbi:hypothetical protein MNBD_BACTEROID04-1189, partial [hydrothermal vent metagenome]
MQNKYLYVILLCFLLGSLNVQSKMVIDT